MPKNWDKILLPGSDDHWDFCDDAYNQMGDPKWQNSLEGETIVESYNRGGDKGLPRARQAETPASHEDTNPGIDDIVLEPAMGCNQIKFQEPSQEAGLSTRSAAKTTFRGKNISVQVDKVQKKQQGRKERPELPQVDIKNTRARSLRLRNNDTAFKHSASLRKEVLGKETVRQHGLAAFFVSTQTPRSRTSNITSGPVLRSKYDLRKKEPVYLPKKS